MKFLQFDSIGGASGDMILAALIDLGVSRDELQSHLSTMPIEPFDIQTSIFFANELKGTQVKINIGSPSHSRHEKHDHSSSSTFTAPSAKETRGLKEIQTLMTKSKLPGRVQETSLKVFQRLAETEARIHGMSPDQILFHEIGAADSIIDIAGGCLALDLLDVNGVAVGPLPLGCGTTECAHGILPVPVPATVELLKGTPVVQTREPFELITPTGAALLSTWKTMDRPPCGSRIIDVGHGFGHRKLTQRPNLLRAFLLEYNEDRISTDDCLVLECNIDDTTPELMGSLLQRLMETGALDAFMTTAQMKKQRPGILLTVLCRPEQRELLLDLIFQESTTFGIREYPVKRTVLKRSSESVETPYGNVKVKIGVWKGRAITRAPEHEDCVRLAQQAGVPIRTVYEAALVSSLVTQVGTKAHRDKGTKLRNLEKI